jgi:hypothetical protein
VLTLVHAMVAGADCIDDCDVLRAGATARVLGHRVMAPSTLGTFLRSFTFGHVRQLDALSEALLFRAWAFGAGPGEVAMTIDIDSTIQQVCGKQKQGSAYGWTKVLGQHPLVATRADIGEVLPLPPPQGPRQRRTRRSPLRPGGDRPGTSVRGHRSTHAPGRLGVPLEARGGGLP